jgi:uncharacterized protein YjiS (DUF1127 family)
MAQLVSSLSFVPNSISRLTAWFEELILEIRRARKAAETIKELNKLTDKELKDIGITRGDIHSIAMEAYYDNRGV